MVELIATVVSVGRTSMKIDVAMYTEDLLQGVFPDAAACIDNIQGAREVPDHPLVNQAMRDSLEEAMDLPQLVEILTRIREGEMECIAKDTPEPICETLLSHLRLTKEDLYVIDGPLNATRLMGIYEGDHSPELRDTPFVAPIAPAFRDQTDMFAVIRERPAPAGAEDQAAAHEQRKCCRKLERADRVEEGCQQHRSAAHALSIDNRSLLDCSLVLMAAESIGLHRVVVGQDLAADLRRDVCISKTEFVMNELLWPDVRALLENYHLKACGREFLGNDAVCASTANYDEIHRRLLVVFGQFAWLVHDCSSAS